MLVNPPDNPLLENIPEPQAVRERLGQSVREARLLRQLLKLSERVARERPAAAGREVPDGR